MRAVYRRIGTLAFFGLMAACAPQRDPENIEIPTETAYQAQYRVPVTRAEAPRHLQAVALNAAQCRPYIGDGSSGGRGKVTGLVPATLKGEVLSRGDLVDLRVSEDESFSGQYVISRDGSLKLPFLGPVRAEGRSPEAVEADVALALEDGAFYQTAPLVSVRVMDFATIHVGVQGAVFEPRSGEIGGVPGDQVDAARQGALGASTEARNLDVALRMAGGVRPDADLSAVEIRRAGRVHRLDLRPVIDGRAVADIMLVSGDEIHVPSRQCFQDFLMKPSAISPPGVSLNLSNLVQPASNNASAAIGREVREFPYGTRFLEAVVDANCVGGARATAADRYAALLTRNPVTDVSFVVERRFEELLRRPDRDDYDPYLLPGDSIACYDSKLTGLSEVARLFGIIGAAVLLTTN